MRKTILILVVTILGISTTFAQSETDIYVENGTVLVSKEFWIILTQWEVTEFNEKKGFFVLTQFNDNYAGERNTIKVKIDNTDYFKDYYKEGTVFSLRRKNKRKIKAIYHRFDSPEAVQAWKNNLPDTINLY